MALELRNVVKRVGAETHIYETSLMLKEGGFNILLGTTLSGKTTLMQLMAGLERPTSGEVWFEGRDVTGVAVQKRNVSMVYQQFINYPNLSVFENIASPLRVARLSEPEIRSRVAAMAELLRLTPMLQRRPSQLSGGQQQRTALARALVKDSDLVLLDEPLANLDYKLREELRDELPKLFADRNCTVVYATTEPTEALLLGGHTATLDEGRVTQFGETSEVYRKPWDLRSARVFSDPPINTAPVAKQGAEFVLNEAVRWPVGERFAGLPEGRYTVGIRPHHLSPTPQSERAIAIEGRVQVTELSGSESIVHFSVEKGAWVSQAHGIHAFRVGETARLFIDVSQCLYFDQDEKRITL
ncbi:ABC transporter ATP-binding protein [Limibacillus halophilus]|uniref:Glycerol transport system ATP-binding protein n=1 Tax=Limibacillus halophilus TaxID=1579333 RepID=A0A839SY10_9PROT|nr:ABC transporter ATP-binding protein [Limibacillus halophilus]MBB3065843.1 glycerol transport system ATP-binding protein [Limibacillus halophilus]